MCSAKRPGPRSGNFFISIMIPVHYRTQWHHIHHLRLRPSSNREGREANVTSLWFELCFPDKKNQIDIFKTKLIVHFYSNAECAGD